MSNRRPINSKLRRAIDESPASVHTQQEVKPVRKRHQKKVTGAIKRLMKVHDETLKKLAR